MLFRSLCTSRSRRCTRIRRLKRSTGSSTFSPPTSSRRSARSSPSCSKGVVTQTLLQKAKGRGRVMAAEIMVCTPAIRALIRDDKVHQIYSSMQAGKKHGMQTLNDALYQLYMQRDVVKEECLRVSSDQNEFLRMIGESPLDDGSTGAAPPAGQSKVAARR